ncbi:MAG: hypothetical protein HXY49_11250 [Ignavibacteriaceae bacterium]|nr:hypothetical protein [Ignavibacteriaceae bacterium]
MNTEVINYIGGDGSSISSAVKIEGANSFSSGIEAMFDYIYSFFNPRDIELFEGRVIFFSEIIIHHVNVITKKGVIKNFYFDTTSFHENTSFDDYLTMLPLMGKLVC